MKLSYSRKSKTTHEQPNNITPYHNNKNTPTAVIWQLILKSIISLMASMVQALKQLHKADVIRQTLATHNLAQKMWSLSEC